MSETAKIDKILLVEDDDKDAELIMAGINEKALGTMVHRVADGEEALQYLDKKNEESGEDDLALLVILDLKLPKVTGMEVLKHIRNTEGLKYLPVVILTSSKEEQDLMAGYSMHANAYVVKPLDVESFMQAVRELGLFWAIFNEPPPR